MRTLNFVLYKKNKITFVAVPVIGALHLATAVEGHKY